MKKRRSAGVALLALVLFFTACVKDSSTPPVEVGTVSYKKLTRDKQTAVQNEIIESLKHDPEYIRYNQELANSAKYWLDRDITKDTKAPLHRFTSGEDAVNYYKSRGLRQPEKFVKNILLRLRFMARFDEKYPQLKEMSLEERQRVFSLAKPDGADKMSAEVVKAYHLAKHKLKP